MNLKQFTTILTNFNENSRVWIYQADRHLSNEEVEFIERELNPFVASWEHHGNRLNASFGVLYNLFIIFVVDEQTAEVSGCGIDKSVHIVKKIAASLQIDFFNRLAISFFNGEKVECINKDCFTELISTDKAWSDDNLVFNNQINNLKELKTNWIIPFKNSWHKDFFASQNNFNLSL